MSRQYSGGEGARSSSRASLRATNASAAGVTSSLGAAGRHMLNKYNGTAADLTKYL